MNKAAVASHTATATILLNILMQFSCFLAGLINFHNFKLSLR